MRPLLHQSPQENLAARLKAFYEARDAPAKAEKAGHIVSVVWKRYGGVPERAEAVINKILRKKCGDALPPPETARSPPSSSCGR